MSKFTNIPTFDLSLHVLYSSLLRTAGDRTEQWDHHAEMLGLIYPLRSHLVLLVDLISIYLTTFYNNVPGLCAVDGTT